MFIQRNFPATFLISQHPCCRLASWATSRRQMKAKHLLPAALSPLWTDINTVLMWNNTNAVCPSTRKKHRRHKKINAENCANAEKKSWELLSVDDVDEQDAMASRMGEGSSHSNLQSSLLYMYSRVSQMKIDCLLGTHLHSVRIYWQIYDRGQQSCALRSFPTFFFTENRSTRWTTIFIEKHLCFQEECFRIWWLNIFNSHPVLLISHNQGEQSSYHDFPFTPQSSCVFARKEIYRWLSLLLDIWCTTLHPICPHTSHSH